MGPRIQDPDVERIPLHFDGASDPAGRQTIIGGLHFHATVQVDPLIRELTQYRDLINLKIQEQEKP